ncbi:MAG: HAD family acid phosphatase [Planctomycetota bacterium]
MRRLETGLVLVAAVATLVGLPRGDAAVADRTAPPADDRLNAVAWVQSSAEYRAIARQTWRAVGAALETRLDETSGSAVLGDDWRGIARPPALIVDVDETVLDNSPFEARLVARGESYSPRAWAEWVREANALPVPGALEALGRAAELGIAVFYVTNRDAVLEEPTRANLARWGFPLDARRDTVLMKGEEDGWGSDKTSRRARVARSHRVLALVGDDLGDFLPGSRSSAADRAALTAELDGRWGTSWFALPNPVYGSWERCLNGFEDANSEVMRARKREALDPRHPRATELQPTR